MTTGGEKCDLCSKPFEKVRDDPEKLDDLMLCDCFRWFCKDCGDFGAGMCSECIEEQKDKH